MPSTTSGQHNVWSSVQDSLTFLKAMMRESGTWRHFSANSTMETGSHKHRLVLLQEPMKAGTCTRDSLLGKNATAGVYHGSDGGDGDGDAGDAGGVNEDGGGNGGGDIMKMIDEMLLLVMLM